MARDSWCYRPDESRWMRATAAWDGPRSPRWGYWQIGGILGRCPRLPYFARVAGGTYQRTSRFFSPAKRVSEVGPGHRAVLTLSGLSHITTRQFETHRQSRPSLISSDAS